MEFSIEMFSKQRNFQKVKFCFKTGMYKIFQENMY